LRRTTIRSSGRVASQYLRAFEIKVDEHLLQPVAIGAQEHLFGQRVAVDAKVVRAACGWPPQRAGRSSRAGSPARGSAAPSRFPAPTGPEVIQQPRQADRLVMDDPA
jgi:hypothetical protein